MAQNNIPAVINKNYKLLNNIRSYIDKFSKKASNRQIIDKFTHIPQYDVLSMPAFRMITDEMIKNSPEGTILMADINDLFVANKFRGKEKVNVLIKNMISKIKNTLDESECSNYKIGKMGDEIYVYMPDKNETQSAEIVDKLHGIREKELTISVGASSDFSKGLINAINEADKKMTVNKSAFKSKRLKNICGNNLNKIIDTVVETQLDKMRLNLENLKSSNKPDLRNTFDKAIEQLDIEEITSSLNKNSAVEPVHEEDTFEKLKNKYTNEAKFIHGDNPKLVNEYVLANMLSKHPVEGVISSEFFQGLGYKDVYRNIRKDKSSKAVDLLAIDLSGLKAINDTLGHEEGDNAISDALLHLKTTLDNKNAKMYSEIIAKGGGNSYVLLDNMPDSMKNDVLSQIQNYGTNGESKYNMSIMCSIKTIDKKDLTKSNFLDNVNNNLANIEENLQEHSFKRKLKDVDEIKGSIKKVYQEVVGMDDVQLLLKNNSEHKKNILELIKSGFENCIEKERGKSLVNHSRVNHTLEKSKNHTLNNLKAISIDTSR